jgi:potassium channel subfamily K, other eukaryote
MVATVLGAYKGRYEKEFNLTTSQRTLMLQTISFLVYLLLGALVYSHVEGWAYLDALYYADFTLLTIGIGDIAPITGVGRGLLFPFAIGGIIILGLVVGSIRSLVLERGKAKLGARMVEKERRRILKEIDKNCRDLLIPIDYGKSKDLQENSDEERKESTERQRREREFHIMRKVQERATARRRWMSLAVSALTWFALWLAGAAVFQVSIICLDEIP